MGSEAGLVARTLGLGVVLTAVNVALLVLALAGQVEAATFTVDSTGVGGDSTPGDAVCDDGFGACTLTAAIEEANATSGTDTIAFNIPGAGPHTIVIPSVGLPTVTDPVIIDGYTQPGATPNTLGNGNNAVLMIELSRNVQRGLVIRAGNSTVRGLVLNRFTQYCIWIDVPAGSAGEAGGSNVIEGNFIGTNVTGTMIVNSGDSGVEIGSLSPGNRIGGTTPAARNIIVGNRDGVHIQSNNNSVQGNFIGTSAVLRNFRFGVWINARQIAFLGTFGKNNTIGGTAAGAGNVISGNLSAGIYISGVGPRNLNNRVEGNLIGTDPTGTVAQPNATGVFITNADANIIGGTTPEARNIISGNSSFGVYMEGSTRTNQVQGNLIGTDITGGLKVPNLNGVFVGVNARTNTIGGTASGAGNVISGNNGDGVIIEGSTVGVAGNKVQGNLIGTDIGGTLDLGNAGNGVVIRSPTGTAFDNLVGGTSPGAGNVISGNDQSGIRISGSGSRFNLVQGNLIGTQADGTSPLGNGLDGVLVMSTVCCNTIGGTTSSAGNTIAYNGGGGVALDVGASGANSIQSDSIHTNSGLGIDLNADGVTPNDAGDGDGGPNSLQNFPVLASATTGAVTTIEGSLNSHGGTFTLQFFSSSACDPSGNGEGQTFLGSSTVTLSTQGTETFSASFGTVVPEGHVITATADFSGSTSEFSECVGVVVCGNGILETGEQCDDSNNANGDCCSSTCAFEGSGSSCGDASDTECTNPDTCDGAGACQDNHEPSGTACGDQGVECLVDATCNGSGGCTNNGNQPNGTSCGDPSDTECTNPDACLSGACQANHELSGTACGDQGVECLVDDTCNGSGSCMDNGNEPASTECRAVAGDCDVAEFCSGTGPGCLSDGFEPATTECRASAGVCDLSENCTGAGPDCPADLFETNGTQCDDLDVCTIGDECQSGICGGDSDTCGDGVLQVSCGEECDGDDDAACPGQCEPICMCPSGAAVPVLPLWGVISLAALLLGGGGIVLRRRRLSRA